MLSEIKDFRNLEKIKIPAEIDYTRIHGLSLEAQEKLSAFRPLTLGQAGRISGITPAAIAVLMVYLAGSPKALEKKKGLEYTISFPFPKGESKRVVVPPRERGIRRKDLGG